MAGNYQYIYPDNQPVYGAPTPSMSAYTMQPNQNNMMYNNAPNAMQGGQQMQQIQGFDRVLRWTSGNDEVKRYIPIDGRPAFFLETSVDRLYMKGIAANGLPETHLFKLEEIPYDPNENLTASIDLSEINNRISALEKNTERILAALKVSADSSTKNKKPVEKEGENVK